MIVLKITKTNMYLVGFEGTKLILSPIIEKALKFEEPEQYDLRSIKQSDPTLFFYLSYLKEYNMKADMEDYYEESEEN